MNSRYKYLIYNIYKDMPLIYLYIVKYLIIHRTNKEFEYITL